jgi:hypothetical protein
LADKLGRGGRAPPTLGWKVEWAPTILESVMKIRAFKLYLECEDKAVARAMNRSHFGVMNWIGSRLKGIREELREPGLEGVDIINIYFCENASLCQPVATWYRLLNVLEYKIIFDVKGLIDKCPVENVKSLVAVASSACALAPWGQVRAIGKVLQEPITPVESGKLERALKRWEAKVDKAAAEYGFRNASLQ